MSLVSRLMNGGIALENDDAKEVEAAAKDIKATVDDDPTTETWMATAVESLVMDIYNVDKAYHVADIIAEAKVITEGADPAVLLEGMILSGVEKIKAAFKKFWAKLKAWFNEIKRQFQIMFLSGKDFIKKFKEEILKKNVKGFTYNGFYYTIDQGDGNVTTVIDRVKDAIDDCLNYATQIDRDAAKANWSADTFKDLKNDLLKNLGAGNNRGITSSGKDDKTSSELEDDFIKNNVKFPGVSDITEMREYITNSYRNGEDSEGADEYENFEKNSKQDMVTFLEGFDKSIKKLEKNEKDFDKMLSTIIKQLDSIKSTDVVSKDADGKDVTISSEQFKAVQYASRLMTCLLNVGKAACSVQQTMHKSARDQYERVLKSYLRYKPAKEGYGADDDDDDDGGKGEGCKESLLDMAMNMMFN